MQDGDAVVGVSGAQGGGEFVVEVEAGDTGDAATEFESGNARTSAQFEEMVAELRLADEPRE